MKTKEKTIKISPDTYKMIKHIAKERDRSLKSVVRLAMISLSEDEEIV